MDKTKQEIINFITKKNIKLIHILFCDILGLSKTITIAANEFENALENGIAFDADIFQAILKKEVSKLFLFPDISTFSVSGHGNEKEIQFYGSIKYADGTPFEGDSRYLLQNAVKEAQEQNLDCMFATKCQFSLLEGDKPYDTAGYLDAPPLDKCQQIRNEICMALGQMGIFTKRAFHQRAAGQNQIDFQYATPLKCADYFMTYQYITKKIALEKGAFACFLPKPFSKEQGNGIHILASLLHRGKPDKEPSIFYESFIAGILNRIGEMSAFFHTTEDAYKRIAYQEIPKYITWSYQYDAPLIHIASVNEKTQPLELFSADSCLNPYLAFTLFIYAGLEGVAKQMPLPDPCNINLYGCALEETKKYQALPDTLGQAVEMAKNSTFIQGILPERVVKSYLEQKQ